MTKWILDFLAKQLRSSAFAIALVACIGVTSWVSVPGIARYDLLFLLCLGLQAGMIRLGWESPREVGVIALFHLIGVLLEWFKVRAGSWSYPETALLKVYGVPLYSGFMYAAVASYMNQAWRQFQLRFTSWPQPIVLAFVLGVVYGQFFLPIQAFWIRVVSLMLVLFVFRRSRVEFQTGGRTNWMPVPVAFLLIGSCIYGAENLATMLGAWTYPYQADGWQPVHVTKVVSWTLLMIVSLTIVHTYRRRVAGGTTEERNAAPKGAGV